MIVQVFTDIEVRVREFGRRVTARDEGAGMVEYALLVALIGVLLIAVIGTLRGGIETTFNKATNALK